MKATAEIGVVQRECRREGATQPILKGKCSGVNVGGRAAIRGRVLGATEVCAAAIVARNNDGPKFVLVTCTELLTGELATLEVVTIDKPKRNTRGHHDSYPPRSNGLYCYGATSCYFG
jgi:hypothetical protein